MIYFDNAASTAVSEHVVKTMDEVVGIYGNPSSIHEAGVKAKGVIMNAKNIIASELNCDQCEIYFTSGATMSNNVAIQGFMNAHYNAKLIISSIEHNDIMMLAKKYANDCIVVNVDHDGFVNMEELKSALKEFEDCPVLCSIQMANSEVGTIQNIDEISEIVHSYKDSYLHTDATQYIPHYKMTVEGVDMMSMSGQKIKCIKGTGVLYVKSGLKLEPIIYGEQGIIGGTENVIGIACIGAAFEDLEEARSYSDGVEFVRDYFIYNAPGELVGHADQRIANNVALLLYGIYAEDMVSLLDQYGVCCSSGSACSSGSPEPSHVLLAMGYSVDDANSVVRFSINEETSLEDVDTVIDYLKKGIELLK